MEKNQEARGVFSWNYPVQNFGPPYNFGNYFSIESLLMAWTMMPRQKEKYNFDKGLKVSHLIAWDTAVVALYVYNPAAEQERRSSSFRMTQYIQSV